MGRPAASKENKKLAVAIAVMVTRKTDQTGSPDDTIARSGKCSIYALLNLLIPNIIRSTDSGIRDGISEVEFNKALQVCRFIPNISCDDAKTMITGPPPHNDTL